MQTFLTYLKKPYQEKGLFLGTLDLLLRAVAVFVWVYLMTVLVRLVVESLVLDYNPLSKLWWLSYSFLICFGASWLAYILLFVRDYNDPSED